MSTARYREHRRWPEASAAASLVLSVRERVKAPFGLCAEARDGGVRMTVLVLRFEPLPARGRCVPCNASPVATCGCMVTCENLEWLIPTSLS